MASSVVYWMHLVFTPVLVIITQVNGNRFPETVSVELGKRSIHDQDMVQIIDPPIILSSGMWITVEYKCTRDRIIGLELAAKIAKQRTERKIFQKAWKCSSQIKSIKKKRVKLKLPDGVAFRPDLFNSKITIVDSLKLKAWNLNPIWWPNCRKYHDAFWRATVKVSYDIHVPPPFSRPSKEGFDSCSRWPLKILSEIKVKELEKCRKEPEIIHTITHPVAINGLQYGVVRVFPKYSDKTLEKSRIQQMNQPMFTISVWLYIMDYCLYSNTDLCSMMYHVTWDNIYLTPLMFVNKQGYLHIQMAKKSHETMAALTNIAVPKRQWFRMVFSFSTNTWRLTINKGRSFNETLSTSYTVPGETHFNDTEGMFVFGAFDNTPSFKGYIGQATFYRNRHMKPEEIPMPSPLHKMFELDLSGRTDRCDGFMDWVYDRTRYYMQQKRESFLADQCHTFFSEILRKSKAKLYDSNFSNGCPRSVDSKSKSYTYLDRYIKRSVRKGRRKFSSHSNLGNRLYSKAVKYVDKGIKYVRRAIPLLKQSSCYGNYDAMFMLATLLNNGVMVKTDELQAQAYLMKGCLGKHRLCCLAMAHKHRHGLDGVPQDHEQAFLYYKYVADTVRADKDKHKETDVLTESVRLSDQEQLQQQTDEEGDVFHWLKYQAGKGVLSAQQHVARALFWGSQGLKRNMASAIEYFKLGAETKDPQALYDYGIILLKGQGAKKNETKGLQHIRESANKNNPEALNALGWYAHNFDRNITSAIHYFEKAYKGGNPDAAYNLGSFYINGEYPGKAVDVDKAWDYFNFAAVRNQIDAGVLIAYLNMKGTARRTRQVYVATEWARYIAEKNPALGHVLRRGLDAYRNGDFVVSLLYYMMAAEAGIEVGSFNLAWLCEENKDGIVSSIGKDCQWRQYNITIQRELQFVDPYALIKMGDYYWYGCGGHRNTTKAANLYSMAATRNDPHAIFNMGFMIEEGAKIHPSVWQALNIPKATRENNFSLLSAVYRKCRDSSNTEAYLPCSMALHRIQLLEIWSKYGNIVQVISFVLSGVVMVLSLRHLLQSFRESRQPDVDLL